MSNRSTRVADEPEPPWQDKLPKYHALGAREVVRFDSNFGATNRLRVWDRIADDLVERVVEGGRTPSTVLGGAWVEVNDPELGPALRLARDDGSLHPTPLEREAAARASEAKAREAEAKAREAAERRIAELEAELRRRG